ncbi:MAG: CPBP family intramembrane glutamic endopeptidase [Opitutaceae bacterium]
MSQADEISPAALAILAIELISGAWLCWKFSPGRAARPARLREWALPPVDFACFIAFAFVGATTVSSAAGYLLRPVHLDPDLALVAGGGVMHAGVLAGLAAFFLLYGAKARLTDPSASPPPVLVSGFVTFLAALPLVYATDLGWGFLLRKAGIPDEQQEMVGILENSHSAALKLTLLAVATVIVPFSEEILFRAGLFRYFRTRAPRWLSILLTSALFGALHVSWGDHMAGLPSLLPLFVLAIVFCLAYERTGRIGTTIVAHALFNLNTFVLVLAGIGS